MHGSRPRRASVFRCVPNRHARNAQARPTTDRSRAEVVVGGGVVGCAAARSLAVDHDPLLVERDRLVGEKVPFPLAPYRLDRFESRSDGFQLTPYVRVAGVEEQAVVDG